jgi:hypothetical protein
MLRHSTVISSMSNYRVTFVDKCYGLRYLLAMAYTAAEAIKWVQWYKGENVYVVSVVLAPEAI